MDCSPPGSYVHGISQEEYGSGLPFSSLADLPDPGIEPASQAFAGWFFTTEPSGKPSALHAYISFLTVLRGGAWLSLFYRWGKVVQNVRVIAAGWDSGGLDCTLVSSAPRAFGPKPTWRRQGLLDFWPVTPELCSVHCPLSLLATAVCVQLSGVFTAVPSGVLTLAVSPIQRCLTNGSELNTLKGSSGRVMRWLRNLNSSPSTEERTSHPGILSSGEELALQQAEDRVLAFCNMERWLLSAPWAVVVRAGPFSQNSH